MVISTDVSEAVFDRCQDSRGRRLPRGRSGLGLLGRGGRLGSRAGLRRAWRLRLGGAGCPAVRPRAWPGRARRLAADLRRGIRSAGPTSLGSGAGDGGR